MPLTNLRSTAKHRLKSLIFVLILVSQINVKAESIYEENFEHLLQGHVEAVITNVEAEKDFNWDKNKITLIAENSELYAAALIATGNLDKAEKFLEHAIKKHPKNKELELAYKQILFYRSDYNNTKLKYSHGESANIELLNIMPVFLDEISANAEIKTTDIEEQENKILKLIKETDNRSAYFPTRLEYLLEIKQNKEVEELAFEIIQAHHDKLFPQTLDFYELANAYRALALIVYRRDLLNNQTANPEKALSLVRKYMELAIMYSKKMSSLWLEEDLLIYRPILKMEARKTKFGYVLPQWIIGFQVRLNNEFEALLSEIASAHQIK